MSTDRNESRALWFKARMADVNLSLRGCAKMVGMDPSALSRAVSGQRKLQVDEIAALALTLGVPKPEIEKRLGVKAEDDGTVAIEGWIDHRGNVELGRTGERTPRIAGWPDGGIVFKVHAPHGLINFLDGATIYFGPKIPPSELIEGKMGLFQHLNSRKWIFQCGKLIQNSNSEIQNQAKEIINSGVKIARMAYWVRF